MFEQFWILQGFKNSWWWILRRILHCEMTFWGPVAECCGLDTKCPPNVHVLVLWSLMGVVSRSDWIIGILTLSTDESNDEWAHSWLGCWGWHPAGAPPKCMWTQNPMGVFLIQTTASASVKSQMAVAVIIYSGSSVDLCVCCQCCVVLLLCLCGTNWGQALWYLHHCFFLLRIAVVFGLL